MTVQLAFPVDAREDDPPPAVVAAIEARIEHDDRARGRYATPARPCRCRRPWGDVRDRTPGHCIRCGRDLETRR